MTIHAGRSRFQVRVICGERVEKCVGDMTDRRAAGGAWKRDSQHRRGILHTAMMPNSTTGGRVRHQAVSRGSVRANAGRLLAPLALCVVGMLAGVGCQPVQSHDATAEILSTRLPSKASRSRWTTIRTMLGGEYWYGTAHDPEQYLDYLEAVRPDVIHLGVVGPRTRQHDPLRRQAQGDHRDLSEGRRYLRGPSRVVEGIPRAESTRSTFTSRPQSP